MPDFDPAPSTLAEVLDPAWLGAMLSARWPGTVVRDVEVVETLVTMATKVRLRLTVDGGGGDVPTALCIKGVLTETGVPRASSIVETLFYARAADRLGVRVPGHVHAALDAGSGSGVVVMRDVIAAGGRFCTALEPFAADDVADGLDQLALLHAAGWQGGAEYDAPWVPRFLDRITAAPVLPPGMLQALLDGPRGDPLPPAIRDADRLQAAVAALAAEVRTRPNCLVHGDAHAGNIYRDSAGMLGIVDWQVLQKGEWAQDVAYHVAATMTPEERRRHERALLDHYLDRLAAAGGPAIDWDEAWSRYRAGMAYGYLLWAMTRKVEPAITHEFVRRLGLAVDDLGTFGVLGA